MPEPESEAEELVSPANSLKRRLLGAAVLLALAAIFLPLLLDGSGSESRFRRVENVREYPPKIIGADGRMESIEPQIKSEPAVAAARNVENPVKPVAQKSPAATPNASQPVPKPAAVADLKAVATAKLEELVATRPEQIIIEETLRRKSPSAEIDAALARIGEATADRVNPPEQTNSILSSEPSVTTPDSTSLAAAWVVQAGSFADQENALRLRDGLRNRGFPSFIATAGDRELTKTLRYRVQVGPLTDRLNVEQRQRQVERITGREALVREYR